MDVILTFTKMTDPDEYYAVNTIPAIAWALELYLKAGARFKDRTIEVVFPAGDHKESMRKKGDHEIVVWISNRKIYVRARCNFKKECKVNTGRVDGDNREALKALPWDEINVRAFFRTMMKWLMRMDLDFKTLIRAFNTVCDRRVVLPLTTKYGKKFDKFNDYRQHRWPEDATPDKRTRFLEEVLVRVSFWIQSAAQVNALDY
jgi:hypothetical protein